MLVAAVRIISIFWNNRGEVIGSDTNGLGPEDFVRIRGNWNYGESNVIANNNEQNFTYNIHK